MLPSYSANRWHDPRVKNITSASEALTAHVRVNGAGIWSGWGFPLDEEGAYDGNADRAAWQASTVNLPCAPQPDAVSRQLDPLRLAGLASRAVQGPLFLVSFAGFIAGVYAQAAWLQHVGAVVGIGFGLTGAVGLWLGRRARRRQEPRAAPPESLYYKK